VIPVSSAKTAEMVKVFENTFRAVNIALVNELTMLCDGMKLNVWEVLDAAFTKPFGIMPFYPGPGVGGHCIPLDPHYLEWKAKEYSFDTHFISLAGEINRKMPAFVREKAMRCLNSVGVAASRSRILVLGVAYKKDVGDYRESPSLKIIHLLKNDGAEVGFYDPYTHEVNEGDLHLIGEPELTPAALAKFDLTIIATNHSNIDYDLVVEHSRLVLDTRNATKKIKAHREKITLL
jgi:UDP-N-acetyl-D-glucosamine dehydrogenase